MDEITSKIASNLAKELYSDLAQPSLKHVGSALESITKIVLSPVSLLEWGFENSKVWLKSKIEERFQNVQSEFITTPCAGVLIPLYTRIGMAFDTPNLRDLYTELLLKAFDSRTNGSVHPSYVFIIEQLSAEEALLVVSLGELNKITLFSEDIPSGYGNRKTLTIEEQFSNFASDIGLQNASIYSSIWLTNLSRLSLVALDSISDPVIRPESFDKFDHYPAVIEMNESRYLTMTDYGRLFVAACTPIQNEVDNP